MQLLQLYRHVLRLNTGEEEGLGNIIYTQDALERVCKEWELDPNEVSSKSLDEELDSPFLPEGEYEFWYTSLGNEQHLLCYGHIICDASALTYEHKEAKYVIKCMTIDPNSPLIAYRDKHQVALYKQ